MAEVVVAAGHGVPAVDVGLLQQLNLLDGPGAQALSAKLEQLRHR